MIGYLILAVLVAFIAVVAVRTIRFRPKPLYRIKGKSSAC